MSFDIQAVRKQFPALSRPEIFLDNPGGTQMVRASFERIQQLMIEANANHGGHFATSRNMDATVDESRRAMAAFLNAERPEEIVFGANMTAFCPTAAAMPARAAPAFPVEAVTTTSAPISLVRATTTELARSLNEAVGLRLSSLIHRLVMPSSLASRE